MCQPCYTGWYYSSFREANIARARAGNLKSQFGITQQQYDEMYEAQNGLCLICGRKCPSGRKLAVDHDHVTKRVRGLLCANCNRGIGLFADNPEWLRRAADYLGN